MKWHERTGGKSVPKFYEVAIIVFVTICFTLICLILSETYFVSNQTRLLIPWIIHLPLFIIPFVWYEFRLKYVLTGTFSHLFHWPRKSTRPFLVLAVFLVCSKIVSSQRIHTFGKFAFLGR